MYELRDTGRRLLVIGPCGQGYEIEPRRVTLRCSRVQMIDKWLAALTRGNPRHPDVDALLEVRRVWAAEEETQRLDSMWKAS